MDIEDLRTLLDYHYWARDRLLDALDPLSAEMFTRDLGSSFKSIRDTTAHIYAAEWAWCLRWHGHSPTTSLPPEQFPDVVTLRSAWRALEADVRAFVEALGPDRTGTRLPYTLLNGTAGNSVFSHMLQHVVNHASYHRGQITTMLRQIDAEPPKPSDLIAFHRIREYKQSQT